MGQIILVVHNVRSALNVGSILRTADGFGVKAVYLTGYTPYPEAKEDPRLPHQRRKTDFQIHKTALGAEDIVNWQHQPDIEKCLNNLKGMGYFMVALEQTPKATNIQLFSTSQDVALIVGNEVSGLEPAVLKQTDSQIHIPMGGAKESFNVSVATGIALYHLSLGRPRQK